MNPGVEQNAPVGTGPTALYPDLVLTSQDRGHRLQIVVEVETGESVNHLEALAQWAHFSKVRAAFHLYVPGGMVDVARRLCEDNHIYVAEIWSYHTVGDQVRFTLVHRNREAPPVQPRIRTPAPPRTPPAVRASAAPRTRQPPRTGAPRKKTARSAKPAKKATPVRKQKRK
ncbi:MAG: hypothetical protein AUH43_09745 [Acidobacteria bacterium 13_1_40CM_65_14]|nr:MAG: hypothetical protein AUH43_09745 [Acidobacteria bacterium 13_1_40CM_65_14]OLC84780.1 MAG: hypothetical protein AUH72_00845 [Acidobacteria bacterium 13_1_40CM_4_65_8]OLE82294.1 MAG: hypothetical protein AUF76_09960 [Acidobacteria bacterium 13_1_20CM_2_65_9]